mmetsp:Transcript_42867/g.137149  ORF Transcript_42867/g.137149 Transcript_42867/m.137149 type:complete len:298 (+) Transcript_42867:107-1000(+)
MPPLMIHVHLGATPPRPKLPNTHDDHNDTKREALGPPFGHNLDRKPSRRSVGPDLTGQNNPLLERVPTLRLLPPLHARGDGVVDPVRLGDAIEREVALDPVGVKLPLEHEGQALSGLDVVRADVLDVRGVNAVGVAEEAGLAPHDPVADEKVLFVRGGAQRKDVLVCHVSEPLRLLHGLRELHEEHVAPEGEHPHVGSHHQPELEHPVERGTGSSRRSDVRGLDHALEDLVHAGHGRGGEAPTRGATVGRRTACGTACGCGAREIPPHVRLLEGDRAPAEDGRRARAQHVYVRHGLF